MAGQKVTVVYELIDRITKKAKTIEKSLKSLEGTASQYDRTLNKLNKAQGTELGKEFDRATKTIARQESALKDLTSRTNDQIKAIKRHVRALEELGDTHTKEYKALQKTLDSLERKRARLDRLTQSTRDHDRAVRGSIANWDSYANMIVESTNRINDHGTALGRLRGQFDGFNRSLRKFTDGSGEIRKAFRDTMDFSFFRAGVVQGLQMFETMTKILGVLPLIGVALGGVTQMMGSLGTGILQVAGSLGRLAGALAIFPGLLAAIGAGMGGFQAIMGTMINPAIKGTEQLKGLDKQIADAKSRVAKAKQDAAKAAEMSTVGESTRATASGALSAKADQQAALDRQKDAEQDLNDLYADRAEIAKTMPPLAAELVKEIEKTKDAWRALWFGPENAHAKAVMQSVIDTLKAVQDFMKSDAVKGAVATYVGLWVKWSKVIQDTLRNPAFQKAFGTLIQGAMKNLDLILQILKEAAPYLNQIAEAINEFTTWSLKGILHWIRFKEVFDESGKKIGEVRRGAKDILKFGEGVDNYFDNVRKSLTAWVIATKNIVSGFRTLAGVKIGDKTIVDIFEGGLIEQTQNFREWATEMSKSGKAAKFFANSIKVMKGMGRVILAIFDAIGMVLSNPKAADETVKFLDNLAGGFRLLGKFMTESLVQNGPKLNAFFDQLGIFFSDNMDNIIRGTGRLIDMFTGLLEGANKFDAITGFIIELRLAMLGLGLVVGQLLSPLARLAGLLNVGGLGGTIASAFIGAKIAGAGGGGKKFASSLRNKGLQPSGARGAERALTFLTGMSTNVPGQLPLFGQGPGTYNQSDLTQRLRANYAGKLNPAFQGAIDADASQRALSGYLMEMEDATKETNKFKSAMKGLKGAVGPALRVLAKAAFWVGLVVGAFEGWRENFLGVRDDVKRLWKTIDKTLIPAFENLWDALNGGPGGDGGILGAINKVFKLVGTVAFKGLIAILDGAARTLSMIVNIVAAVVDPISRIVETIGAILKFIAHPDFGKLKADLAEIWDGVGETFIRNVQAAADAFAHTILVAAAALGLGTQRGRNMIFGPPGSPRGTRNRQRGASIVSAIPRRGAQAAGTAGGTQVAKAAGKGLFRRGASRAVGVAGAALAPETLGGSLLLSLAIAGAIEAGFYGYDKITANAAEGVDKAKESKSALDNWVIANQEVINALPTQQRTIVENALAQQTDLEKDRAALDGLIGESIALSDKMNEMNPKFTRALDAWESTGKTAQELRDLYATDKAAFDAFAKSHGMEQGMFHNQIGDFFNQFLPTAIEADSLDTVISEKEKNLNAIAERMDRSLASVRTSVDRINNRSREIADAAANNDMVQREWDAIFGEAVQKSSEQQQMERDLAAYNRIQDQLRTLNEGPGGSENWAKTQRLERQATNLVNRVRAREAGPQGGATEASAAAEASAGYSGTEKGKGAILKFHQPSLRLFKTQIGEIRIAWGSNINRMARKVTAFLTNTTTALTDAAVAGSPIPTAAFNLGKSIADQFSMGLSPLTTYLDTIKKEVEDILITAGQGSPVWGSPFTPSGGSSTGGGGAPSSAPSGDSATGTGIPAAFMGGGGITNPGRLSELQDNLEGQAMALLNAIPGMKTISSVLRPGAITSSGNVSQHSFGQAVDFTLGSKSAMAQAGQWIQANAGKFGVNPSQVFYPGHGANGPDHEDHVHVGFGGPGGGGFADMMQMGSVTSPPDFANTLAGAMGGGLANMAYNAMTSLTSQSLGGFFGGSGNLGPNASIVEIIRWAASQYGANADGLVRIAQRESTLNPNAINNWDSNAAAGHPSQGLFQFIESTFNDFAAKAFNANPTAWEGVPRAWMNPTAQSLAAAWAFTHGQGGHWATAESYGRGGHFKANRPTPVIVGDRQPEEVRVTPLSGPNKGKFGGGGGTTVVNSTVNLGTIIADDEGIARLTEAIGEQFHSDLRAARLDAVSKGDN